jgi:hypothetical protein
MGACNERHTRSSRVHSRSGQLRALWAKIARGPAHEAGQRAKVADVAGVAGHEGAAGYAPKDPSFQNAFHTRVSAGSAGRPVYKRPRFAGAFAEPSDGLEPSTPSLPCDPNGNRWQPVATVCR